MYVIITKKLLCLVLQKISLAVCWYVGYSITHLPEVFEVIWMHHFTKIPIFNFLEIFFNLSISRQTTYP